jgi:hypothetical protein
MVLILIARKAALILLVVISPLAFVAYLLPNTEQWFKKWWKIFSSLLLLFPVVGVIFGASVLAARVVNNSGADPTDSTIMLQITALGIMAIPLFAVPLVLKGALSAAGSVGSKLANLQDRANKSALNKAKTGRLGEAKAAFDARRQENQVSRRLHGGYIGKGRLGRSLTSYGESRGGRTGRALQWIGAPAKKLDNSRLARTIGADRGAAAATSAYHKLAREEMERQESTMSEMNASQLYEVLTDQKQSSERRAAAAKRITQVGGDQHVEQAFDYMMTQGAVHKAGGDAGFNDVQQLAASELLRRKPSGISTSQANALNTGDLADAGGYYAAFKARIQEGKFGAKDYASMQTDDIVRLAEMANSTDPALRLSDEDISHIMTEYANIENDETLKGTLTEERKNLFAQIAGRASPTKLTGKDYNLAKLKTP